MATDLSMSVRAGWRECPGALGRLTDNVMLGAEDWDDWDPDGEVDETGTETHATDGPGLGVGEERGL
jgi:hypothetical protein